MNDLFGTSIIAAPDVSYVREEELLSLDENVRQYSRDAYKSATTKTRSNFPGDDELFQCGTVSDALFRTIAGPKKYEKPTRFNLIYHITPFAANDAWRWNVSQLSRRLQRFNGKIVVAVVQGEQFAPLSEVKAAFGIHCPRVQFIAVENDVQLREAVSFVDLLRSVESRDPSEATFYAHARGVTKPDNWGTHAWTMCMYRHLLDDVPNIARLLSSHPAAGVSFRFPDIEWIYPGSFYWFRNDVLFGKEGWHRLENTQMPNFGNGWAVEAFPNRFFEADGARIRPSVKYTSLATESLYDPAFWKAQRGVTSESMPAITASLSQIYELYDGLTDKGALHSYIPFYEALLAPFRHRSATIVEIGVYKAGSLRMWRDYFSAARIVGIDIVDRPDVLPERTEFIRANACTMEPIEADIVIEDASHLLCDQVETFKRWWPHVRRGGHYVIEDIQSDADLAALLEVHPFTVLDFRKQKGRYDDVILWAVKP